MSYESPIDIKLDIDGKFEFNHRDRNIYTEWLLFQELTIICFTETFSDTFIPDINIYYTAKIKDADAFKKAIKKCKDNSFMIITGFNVTWLPHKIRAFLIHNKCKYMNDGAWICLLSNYRNWTYLGESNSSKMANIKFDLRTYANIARYSNNLFSNNMI